LRKNWPLPASKKHLQDEQQFFANIRDLLRAGREKAYHSVNTVMVKTYWQIGRRIVEREQQGKARAGYGEQLIVGLSRYLTDCFGKGFSVANLWNFKQFYMTFSDFKQFSTQCVGNLRWTHIRLIMRLNDKKERHLLKCFVIIDLKTEKLTHQDIGQMDMYVRMFDELKRGEGDNPTLGIILCADKDETMVKYSVLKENKQLFASKYKTILPTEKELVSFIEREYRELDHDGE
jgi:hypothetical protein